MANSRSANTYYVDTVSVSLPELVSLNGIIVSPSGGAGVITIADDISTASYPEKLTVSCLSGESVYLDFKSAPIQFAKGIRIKVLTNCVATLILTPRS